jgi:endo-1,4-beta-D-glucanase Y
MAFAAVSSAPLRLTSAALLFSLVLFVAGLAAAQAQPAHPFGGHSQRYAAGAIKPAVPQATLDAQTAAFYDLWKASYLKKGCAAGQYYVKADTDRGAMVVSEGQGYGMLIVAMMAGHDPQAQKLFDGLHRYNLAHPSHIDRWLMAYAQDTDCKSIFGTDSATDGDMDAAYALLLAHKQWGSSGDVNYLLAAKRIIAAIKRSNINESTKLTNLGDWVTTVGETSKYFYATRSSDWMPDHFRAFARKASRAAWTPVLDAHLYAIDYAQNAYAPETGLLSDFYVNSNVRPRPAPPRFLEGDHDGRYSYNACRDPWRIGLDAAISGDSRSKGPARRISEWIRERTDGDPAGIRDGYTLAGRQLVGYQTMSFVPPFAVAAMSDPNARGWLTALWRRMVKAPQDGYYPDSLKLLAMLVVSRNWLTP